MVAIAAPASCPCARSPRRGDPRGSVSRASGRTYRGCRQRLAVRPSGLCRAIKLCISGGHFSGHCGVVRLGGGKDNFGILCQARHGAGSVRSPATIVAPGGSGSLTCPRRLTSVTATPCCTSCSIKRHADLAGAEDGCLGIRERGHGLLPFVRVLEISPVACLTMRLHPDTVSESIGNFEHSPFGPPGCVQTGQILSKKRVGCAGRSSYTETLFMDRCGGKTR